MTGQGLHPTRLTRLISLISVLTTASLAVVVGAVVVGCAAVDDGAVDGGNEVVDDDCPIGVVEASSVSFAERLCLTAASSEAGPHVVMASDPRWSWDVQSFGAEVQAPPFTLDGGNSAAFGRYERDGLSWVVSTGAIGGQDLGQSSLTVRSGAAADNGAGDLVVHLDGVAVPDFDNDSLDSVFITVDAVAAAAPAAP